MSVDPDSVVVGKAGAPSTRLLGKTAIPAFPMGVDPGNMVRGQPGAVPRNIGKRLVSASRTVDPGNMFTGTPGAPPSNLGKRLVSASQTLRPGGRGGATGRRGLKRGNPLLQKFQLR